MVEISEYSLKHGFKSDMQEMKIHPGSVQQKDCWIVALDWLQQVTMKRSGSDTPKPKAPRRHPGNPQPPSKLRHLSRASYRQGCVYVCSDGTWWDLASPSHRG